MNKPRIRRYNFYAHAEFVFELSMASSSRLPLLRYADCDLIEESWLHSSLVSEYAFTGFTNLSSRGAIFSSLNYLLNATNHERLCQMCTKQCLKCPGIFLWCIWWGNRSSRTGTVWFVIDFGSRCAPFWTPSRALAFDYVILDKMWPMNCRH